MFKIGDQVAHFKEGVCTIVEIGPLNISVSDKDKEYYTLKPIYNPSGTLYIPVDCEKRQLRELITEDEAKALVEAMPEIDILEIKEEKKRELLYKEALLKNECVAWIALLKTTLRRKKERIAVGKKVINVDERYLSSSERFVYGELAVALHISREEIKDILADQLK